jgi:hypothetical protein
MSDPLPAPQFNLTYAVKPTDIGEGYAKGITAAGTSLAQAIGSVSQVYTQNRNADDMLTAMQANKMITPDEYEAVAGKSLGAKQQLLGMYATEYASQQAQQRALALQKGGGAVDIGVAHAKLLDTINQLRQGYSTDPRKTPYQPAQQQPAQQQQQPAQPAPGTVISKAMPGPIAPGTKVVQVKDSQGNLSTAYQTLDNKLIDPKTGNVLQ